MRSVIILEENCLPELATDLFLENTGVWGDDVWISMEAHSISLPDKYTSKCPAVGSMVVVYEEVGNKDHGLNRAN